MLFNSYLYIFFFLPIVLLVYFLLNKTKTTRAGKVWLVLASLFFYGFWNFAYIPLLVVSILVNYMLGIVLSTPTEGATRSAFSRRSIVIIGIIFNIGLLAYYKYFNFFIYTINTVFDSSISAMTIVLPLAISFFTFQQIAFLVDSYTTETKENDFLNYCLFVTFFPRLIAGPIVYHKEMMPQFANPQTKIFNYKNVSFGIVLFFIGLFKKIVIADSFNACVKNGFDVAPFLNFFEAWIASLSYTLQIYFDFSGYTDMALGSAYLFNIKVPKNFDSPYKALNIQEFWRRWHITLSRWLVKYLYIPLGGNRRGMVRTLLNIFITFLLCGIWHGAGWTFVAWGALHGLGIMAYRIWRNVGVKLPTAVSWGITFLYVNCAWVFFRAQNFSDATKVLKGMCDLKSIVLPRSLESTLHLAKDYGISFGAWLPGIKGDIRSLAYVILGLILCIACKNSLEIKERITLHLYGAIAVSLLAVFSLMWLNQGNTFMYFQF